MENVALSKSNLRDGTCSVADFYIARDGAIQNNNRR